MSHPKYRSDIDGLRAIAVLAVVFFHAAPDVLPGGYVGVDVFFVISGYLISTIVFSEVEQGRFSLTNFYGRRIRRIFPVFYAYIAPEPSGFKTATVRPAAAFYSTDMSEFLLPYEAVRSSSDPEGALRDFLKYFLRFGGATL